MLELLVTIQWSSVLENIAEVRLPRIQKVVIERTRLFSSARRPDIIKFGRSQSDFSHTVVIAVRQLNLDNLEALVHDISDPDSKNYGQHKSMADIQDITSNAASTNYVISYLERTWHHEQFTMAKSIFGDFITGTKLLKNLNLYLTN
jgi:hypothetical protein